MANPHVPCIHCGEIITWRCAYEIRRAKQGPACSKECARAHMYRESRARLAAKSHSTKHVGRVLDEYLRLAMVDPKNLLDNTGRPLPVE